MKFDELNQLRDYFSVMNVDDIEKRVLVAQALTETLFFVFTLIDVENKLNKKKNPEDYYDLLALRFGDIFDEEDISYEDETLHDIAQDVVDVTFKHLEEPRFTSRERALDIAEDTTNITFSDNEYKDALREGKKFKVWVSEGDDRVRLWHEEVDGTRIPIDKYFQVGLDKMLHPHDYVNGSTENLARCRCRCLYEYDE